MNEERELFLNTLSKVTSEVNVINNKLMAYLQSKHFIPSKNKNHREPIKGFGSVTVNNTLYQDNAITEVYLNGNQSNQLNEYTMSRGVDSRENHLKKESNNQSALIVEIGDGHIKQGTISRNQIKGEMIRFRSEILNLSNLIQLYVVDQKNLVQRMKTHSQEINDVGIYSVYRAINEMFSRISLINDQEIRAEANQLKRQLDSSINLLYSLN